MTPVKITDEGKVEIPEEIRAFLKLNPGDHIHFIIKPEGQVIIQVATSVEEELPPKLQVLQEKLQSGEKLDFRDFVGVLHREGMKPVAIAEMDEAVRGYIANQNL